MLLAGKRSLRRAAAETIRGWRLLEGNVCGALKYVREQIGAD
jgi:hypothetical protein